MKRLRKSLHLGFLRTTVPMITFVFHIAQRPRGGRRCWEGFPINLNSKAWSGFALNFQTLKLSAI